LSFTAIGTASLRLRKAASSPPKFQTPSSSRSAVATIFLWLQNPPGKSSARNSLPSSAKPAPAPRPPPLTPEPVPLLCALKLPGPCYPCGTQNVFPCRTHWTCPPIPHHGEHHEGFCCDGERAGSLGTQLLGYLWHRVAFVYRRLAFDEPNHARPAGQRRQSS